MVPRSMGLRKHCNAPRSASLVTPVCHSNLIDHPIWTHFGRHPAPHAAVGSQDHGEGLSTLTRARPKSEITVWNCILVRFWDAFWTSFGPHFGNFGVSWETCFLCFLGYCRLLQILMNFRVSPEPPQAERTRQVEGKVALQGGTVEHYFTPVC